ncbi:MAG: hypothetical protein JXA44_09060 [Methanospirillaceae archaeon]|nr:hypothetical protein [Methanospirillaceae archaeon]
MIEILFFSCTSRRNARRGKVSQPNRYPLIWAKTFVPPYLMEDRITQTGKNITNDITTIPAWIVISESLHIVFFFRYLNMTLMIRKNKRPANAQLIPENPTPSS